MSKNFLSNVTGRSLYKWLFFGIISLVRISGAMTAGITGPTLLALAKNVNQGKVE